MHTDMICVRCECRLVPLRNAIPVVDHLSDGRQRAASGDVWECPNCKIQIVTGMGAFIYGSAAIGAMKRKAENFVKCFHNLRARKEYYSRPENINEDQSYIESSRVVIDYSEMEQKVLKQLMGEDDE